VGDKHLRTIGPWSVAQGRIVGIGAGDPADGRLRQNLGRFAERYGADVQPLDMKLHAVLDAKFSQLVEADDGAGPRFEAAKEHYRNWKARARSEAPLRSPGSQRIGHAVLRLVCPLFPPQVQVAIHLARTAMQAFEVVHAALSALSVPPEPTTSSRNPELQKIL